MNLSNIKALTTEFHSTICKVVKAEVEKVAEKHGLLVDNGITFDYVVATGSERSYIDIDWQLYGIDEDDVVVMYASMDYDGDEKSNQDDFVKVCSNLYDHYTAAKDYCLHNGMLKKAQVQYDLAVIFDSARIWYLVG